MRVAMFYHSLVSDWNHGNAHFLRGVASELIARGHEIRIFEPRDGWSRANLVAEYGDEPARAFAAAFPNLESLEYDAETLQIGEVLDGVELAIVHEWNDPKLVSRIGEYRASTRGLTLLFHDTHHRAVTAPEAIRTFDLSHYDGVLAYGRVLRDMYLRRGWARQAWTWHEAADTRVFYPARRRNGPACFDGDIVWIGNWGDEERTEELREFFIEPVKALRLRAAVYGVRYPEPAKQELARAGIEYRGWAPNYAVPEIFARFRATVHVPRRPYTRALPGIPTIRVFEALACAIPLVSAPWDDPEHLFTAGRDYLVARDTAEMKTLLQDVLSNERFAHDLAARGRRTILQRHTCAHRVDELLAIYDELCGRRAAREVVA